MNSRAPLKLKVDFDSIVGFLYFSISNLSRMFLQLLGIPREVTYGLYLVLLLLYFLKYLPKLKVIDIVYYLIIIPIVTYGLVHYGSYIGSNSRVFAVLLLFLPSYLFFRFYDQERLFNMFVAAQYFAIVYLLFYYMVFVRFQSKYSMDYGYWIILPIITFVYLYIQRKNPIHILLSLLATATLVLSGNRGALLLGILCTIYFYIFDEDNYSRGKKWVIRVLILGILAIFVVVTSDLWLSYLGRFSGTSRTIQKLIEGNLLQSTTREHLYVKVTTLISNAKDGYGPMASRMLLLDEPYPHSLLYELQMDFGVILGAIITIVIIAVSVANLIDYRKDSNRLIVGYIELLGIGSLMVSSSYYYEIYVPATIALFMINRENRRKMVYEEYKEV